MTTENLTTESAPASPARIFWRGFLIRALYGVVGLAIGALVRPDLVGTKRFLIGGLVYAAICVIGGARDMKTGELARLRLFGKSKVADAALAVFFIYMLIRLWTKR
jgi:hypothetical protein